MPSYSKKVSVPGKNAQQLYDKVSQEIENFLAKTPVGKFDLERDPAGRKVRVKSSMITGTLSCSDGAIQLDASLSLLAAPFRSKLDEGIEKWVAKTFA